MENELLELAATITAAAGSVVAFVKREVVAGLIAAAVAILAFAATLEAL